MIGRVLRRIVRNVTGHVERGPSEPCLQSAERRPEERDSVMSTKQETEASLAKQRLPIAREAHDTAKQVHQEATQKHEKALVEESGATAVYEETPSLENKHALDEARAAVTAAKGELERASRDVRDTKAKMTALEKQIEEAELEARRLELEKRASLGEFHKRTAGHFKAFLEAEKALRAACLAIDAEYQASVEAAKGAGVHPFSAEHLKLPIRLAHAGNNPRALRWLVNRYVPRVRLMTTEDPRALDVVRGRGLDSLLPGEERADEGDVAVLKAELEIVKSSLGEWTWQSRIRDERCRRAIAGATDDDALYELNDRRVKRQNDPDGNPLPEPERRPLPPGAMINGEPVN